MCLLAAALIAILSFFIFTSHLMAQQPSLVIRNISVIDGLSPEIQPDRTVVIFGNRIKAIGEEGKVAIPRRAKFIDGRGKYVIPGLGILTCI
jgi:imidazolonepropionase-like amidohydrolase